MKNAKKVTDWLLGLDSVESARAVCVTIKDKTYEGSHYVQPHWTVATERVVAEGPMEVGAIIRFNRIMLLGLRPRLRTKSNVFVCEAEFEHPLECCYEPSDEWYIGCFYEEGVISEYAPFGNNFILMHHTPMNFGYYAGWKIDTGEPRAYDRVLMTVEYLK